MKDKNVGWPIGLVNGRLLMLPMLKQRQGVLIFAPPGTGKTAALIIPAILFEAFQRVKRSVIIVDPKGDEIANITVATLARTHRILVWDLGNPDTLPPQWALGFDPLRMMLPDQNDKGYVLAVSALTNSWFWATRGGEQTSEAIWVTMPLAFLQAALLTYLDVEKQPGRSFLDFGVWIRSLSYEAFIAAVEQARSPVVRINTETVCTAGKTERFAASVWVDVQHRFQVLDSPTVRMAMDPTRVPIDWNDFVTQPTALYLLVGSRDAATLQPLLSLFLSCAYRSLGTIAERYPSHVLPREVRIIIDEFANLNRIWEIEKWLATTRGYGIGHLLAIQSRSQLKRHYGDEAQSIVENLVTKLCLGGASPEDAEWFSKQCGTVTRWYPSPQYTATGLFGHSRSSGFTPHTEPLISQADIIHMEGEVILSTPGLPPVRAALMPYYKDPRLMQRLQEDEAELARIFAAQKNQPVHATRVDATQPSTPSDPFGVLQPRHTPPGCPDAEWNNTPQLIRDAVRSLEHDTLSFFSYWMNWESVHEEWTKTWPACSPGRCLWTESDAARVPAVMEYIADLSSWLKLDEWLKTFPQEKLNAAYTAPLPPVPIAPRGCEAQWQHCSMELREACRAIEYDVLALAVSNETTREGLHARWRAAEWSTCAPVLWARITDQDAADMPGVMAYLRGFTYLLGINSWLHRAGVAPPSPLRGRGKAPSGYTQAEWDAIPESIREALLSLQDDAFALVTRHIFPEELEAEWTLTAPYCSPGRIAAIMNDDAARAPHMMERICQQARLLRIDVATLPAPVSPPSPFPEREQVSLPPFPPPPFPLQEHGTHEESEPVMPGHRQRDVPPPGCTNEEWDAASAALRVTVWSMEDDLYGLATERIPDRKALSEMWTKNAPRSSPSRWQKITAADAATAPTVFAVVKRMAKRLHICHNDEDPW